MYFVNITYFKSSGKYYAEGEYRSEKDNLSDIFKECREMLKSGNRPGLVDGPCEFYAVVESPEHPHNHPCLIVPENTLCSPDNPPFDTLEPMAPLNTPKGREQASWCAELMRIGTEIRKHHPAHCRCSSKVVTGKLTIIARDTPDPERLATLQYIERQHAKWCASEAWTKEGGKYAKSLEAWLSPTRRLWENEPLLATAKAEYVDRYAMESGGAE